MRILLKKFCDTRIKNLIYLQKQSGVLVVLDCILSFL